MNIEALEKILKDHAEWLEDASKGACADLIDADLIGASLISAKLRGAKLRGADLRGTKLRGADLQGADLQGADLQEANLFEADLFEADLRHCTGNGKEIKNILLDIYEVVYTKNIMCIGCKQYTITEWFEFSDTEIETMSKDALKWWDKYKDALKALISIDNL